MTLSFYDLSNDEQLNILRRLFAPGVIKTTGKTGCHELQKYLNVHGYGQIDLHNKETRKTFLIHRLMFEFFNGRIPSQLQILHSCDNPKCVNSEHLSLGTSKENVQDMIAKKRHKSIFLKGSLHPYSKLTETQVLEIKALAKNKVLSRRKIGQMYNVSRATIDNIALGRNWSHIL